MKSLSAREVRRLRLHAQRLDGASRAESALEVVQGLCAVQAQEMPSAVLAVRPRSAGVTAADVAHAQADERRIVQAWSLRGTLHLTTADDLGWLLPLLGPVFIRKNARRYKQLGLTERIREQAVEAIRDILRQHDGPMPRADLFEQMAGRGIPTEGQAAYHLVRHAALLGMVCFGPEGDGGQTFALLEDWAGVTVAPPPGQTVAPPPGETVAPLPGDEARIELARRYLLGYGPVTPHDFASWTGLGVRESRAAFEALADDLIEVEVDGSTLWLHESLADAPIDQPAGVCLLPAYDPYLLGYKSRNLIVADEYAKRIHPGGGFIRPTLLVDGMAAGTWKLQQKEDAAVVTVEPFEPLPDDTRRALADEVEDVGRYLQSEASLRLT